MSSAPATADGRLSAGGVDSLWERDDVVVRLRDGAVACGGASEERRVIEQRDAGQREDVALPLRRRADGGRASDLPVHVLGLRAVDQDDVAGGRERRTRLEDEVRVRIAAAAERQRAGNADAAGGAVDA